MMRKFTMTRKTIVTIICLLLVLLFAYGAWAKLVDYSGYRTRIGESPFIAPFAGMLAWLIPVIELAVAGLLILRTSRLAGLFTAFGLLFIFTVYMTLMLWFSTEMPCPCVGIPQGLSWEGHIVFNCGLLFLNAIGIALETK